MQSVLDAIKEERSRQDFKWGIQNHPNGTGSKGDANRARLCKIECAVAVERNILTWRDILIEEVYEAFAESDTLKLREELIQVMAVAAAWVECLDRNKNV